MHTYGRIYVCAYIHARIYTYLYIKKTLTVYACTLYNMRHTHTQHTHTPTHTHAYSHVLYLPGT
jgi:hypothetical protein